MKQFSMSLKEDTIMMTVLLGLPILDIFCTVALVKVMINWIKKIGNDDK